MRGPTHKQSPCQSPCQSAGKPSRLPQRYRPTTQSPTSAPGPRSSPANTNQCLLLLLMLGGAPGHGLLPPPHHPTRLCIAWSKAPYIHYLTPIKHSGGTYPSIYRVKAGNRGSFFRLFMGYGRKNPSRHQEKVQTPHRKALDPTVIQTWDLLAERHYSSSHCVS